MPCETAVPNGWRDASFACTRAHARDYLGEGGGLEGGLGSGQQLSRVTVGSEGGQGQEFLGVRECLLSTHEPGNEGEESFLEAVHQRPQGRCCSLKRTPRWEAANILSSLVQLHREGGGKGGNFRCLGRPGGICLATVPDRVNSTEPNSTWW